MTAPDVRVGDVWAAGFWLGRGDTPAARRGQDTRLLMALRGLA